MAINLELPRKLQAVVEKAHQGAAEMLRPISRKWDLREHEYPVELDTLADHDLSEHADVYERIHLDLQRALGAIDDA